MDERRTKIRSHYDATAETYHSKYDRDNIYDTTLKYPANYVRLQLLLNAFVSKGVKRVIEVGVGEGTPLTTLAKAGIDVWGFDVSLAMVEKSKERLKAMGMDPDQIFLGDIEDPTTYVHALRDGPFDGLVAMGVMPHVEKDSFVLNNLSSLVRPGGSVFIEFRNRLFSLFTFNRNTLEFILDDLLCDVSGEIKELVRKDLEPRLRMNEPEIREKISGTSIPGYDAILSKFHNPFEMEEFFKRHNFCDIKLHWYHYHPSMPYLQQQSPKLFRKDALMLEHESSNWRGYFLCSAFVVEATKKEEV